ncbi:MAG: MBL fold metallo-hydrolase [Clostridia bacterium]
MQLSFLGADREVTGSCYLLEVSGKRLMVDCGMEQGKDIYENQALPAAAGIDALLLTHAHIDHSGKLPMLYAQGFRGPIYATQETCALCDIMLRDSAHIQEFEAEWRNRKAERSGGKPYEPLYTMDDAVGAIGLLCKVSYGEDIAICPGVTARFTDAGHLLGSASITLALSEGAVQKTLVFSGDIGNTRQPILRDPDYLTDADYVVMESTYGDRSHGPRPDYIAQLSEILQATFDRGGNVVVPSFAVGRTQEMLYFLRQIKQEGRVKGHEDFTVYVDSPLAIEATQIFGKSGRDCFDEETNALLDAGINPIALPGLRTTVTSDESKAINFDKQPSVILSASGMCEAGRIRHHLKHNLWRPECTILFVGYQAEGTVGRLLIEGATQVKLFGETIEVRAEIDVLDAVSGHADNEGLIKWASAFDKMPQQFFITHGDEEPALTLASRIEDELGGRAVVPYNGDVWDLAQEKLVRKGSQVKVARAAEEAQEKPKRDKRKAEPEGAHARLVGAGERLIRQISRSKGMPAKLMGRFADQINALCDRWGK